MARPGNICCVAVSSSIVFHRSFLLLQMESDPNVQCAVETMEDGAFASYLSGRQAAVAGLSSGMLDYDGKKDAAEMLRTFARITVTAGAAGEDLTMGRRADRLVRLRQNLFAARSLLSFVESK